MSEQEIEQLQQQASAWQQVCEALDDACPHWLQAEGTGEECAVAAIKRLGATQPQAPQGGEVARWRDLLRELVECVQITPGGRMNHLDFEKYSRHLDGCPRPRGDQSCGCGYSSMRAGLDAHLDECMGYHDNAAIDKARDALLAPTETPEAGK